jgi:hemerythrin-like metal-binding protein
MSATILEWSASFELGVPSMDDVHREFVERLNGVILAADGELLARLDALVAHTERHFAEEDRAMVASQFPPLGCHRHEHEQVLAIMREVRQRVAGDEAHLGQVLARALVTWFRHHAATMDRMLAYWLSLPEHARPRPPGPAAHGEGCCAHGAEAPPAGEAR